MFWAVASILGQRYGCAVADLVPTLRHAKQLRRVLVEIGALLNAQEQHHIPIEHVPDHQVVVDRDDQPGAGIGRSLSLRDAIGPRRRLDPAEDATTDESPAGIERPKSSRNRPS